jgi:RNA polymerase sigma-70 factor, ECF subfamily
VNSDLPSKRVPTPGDTSMDVRGAVAGDAAAVDRVVRRMEPLLLADAAYRLKRTGLKDVEPEDVVAEAWAVALPKLGRIGEYEGRRTPVLLAFLTTTLRNVVGGLLRRRAVRGETAPLEASPSGGLPSSASPAAPGTGVVTRAARNERNDVILAALGRLEEIDREIILLRGIEQRGNSEVAVLLSLAPTAAAMRYRRALDRLRSELPESVFDELEG